MLAVGTCTVTISLPCQSSLSASGLINFIKTIEADTSTGFPVYGDAKLLAGQIAGRGHDIFSHYYVAFRQFYCIACTLAIFIVKCANLISIIMIPNASRMQVTCKGGDLHSPTRGKPLQPHLSTIPITT